MTRKERTPPQELRERAKALRLYGLLASWATLSGEPWVQMLIELEETERARRSQDYRLRNAKIGLFKDRADFDWKHPKKIDRLQIDELFTLDFVGEGQMSCSLVPTA